MPDTREDILAQLVTVCAGVTGIVSAERNRTDVPLNARPAVTISGGAEQLRSQSPATRFGEKQLMELTPQITLLVRSDSGAEGGSLMSLFRNRLVAAILSDATLRAIVGTSGGCGIRYEGCNETEPTPESKEPRLDLQISFTYMLRLSDIAAA